MAELVLSSKEYTTFTAKVINAIAIEEANLLEFPTKVFSFGTNPPTFESLTAPFILHTPALYEPTRHSSSGDAWKRDLLVYSLIPCIHEATFKNLRYPPSFTEPQLHGDAYFDAFCDRSTIPNPVRVRMCDFSGADDLETEQMRYEDLTSYGLDGWIGWSIIWRAICYSF